MAEWLSCWTQEGPGNIEVNSVFLIVLGLCLSEILLHFDFELTSKSKHYFAKSIPLPN